MKLRSSRSLPPPGQKVLTQKGVNVLQSSTQGLAPEILAIIFEHACQLSRSTSNARNRDGFHPNHFQLTLAGVSSLWRQIVYSSPQLWTFILLNFDDWRVTEGRLELLRLHLRCSGTLDLDIQASFAPGRPRIYNVANEWPKPNVLIHRSVDGMILENLNRIRSLHLYEPSPKWLSYTSQLPRLTSFSFICYVRYPTTPPLASFPNSPHLHELSFSNISHIDLRPVGTNWSTITILKLGTVGLNACLTLLALCTNVVEFYAYPERGTPQPSPLTWVDNTTRDALKIFRWGILADPAELRMFEHLHLPALQKLYLRVRSGHGRQSSLQAFCNHLPPTLSTFHLAMSCEDNDPIEDCILKYIPRNLQIEALTINCCAYPTTVSQTLTCLVDARFLPKLRRLEIIDPIGYGCLEVPADCGDLILEMIRARAARKNVNEFYLELKNVSVQWSAGTRECLQRVPEETGLKLTFVEEIKSDLFGRDPSTLSMAEKFHNLEFS